MHPSRNTTDETPRQMQYAVWILERAIDLMPPGVEMLALLINFGGKKRNPTSISNAKLMLYILQNHYVERLGIALCINVPWIFKAFWNAIYPFIDPVTKGKCKFDEAIKDEVPNAQLATDFGGLLDFPYDHESYWPQLVKLTEQRRAEQLERFRTLCDSQVGASEWVIRGGDERRSTAPAKQDSGYHEAVSPVAARAESSNGSTVVEKASPVYEAEGDDESQLDRFYTSQQELPPQLESNEWENQTAVSHGAKPHAKEHGDASFFAAVVGGVSAGLVGARRPKSQRTRRVGVHTPRPNCTTSTTTSTTPHPSRKNPSPHLSRSDRIHDTAHFRLHKPRYLISSYRTLSWNAFFVLISPGWVGSTPSHTFAEMLRRSSAIPRARRLGGRG